MGKTSTWLRRFVAKLRSNSTPKDKSASTPVAGAPIPPSSPAPAPEFRDYGADDARKHAIAVAEASAAAAKAALAAAQAAAAVVRLTASGRLYAASPAHVSPRGARETRAALVIQSHFRGYLARRALRALKGLVKLQALVRGHITRKKTAENVRSIEAMLRAQERARSLRACASPISSDKSPLFYHHGPQTPEKWDQTSYSKITSNTQSPISKGPITPEKLEQTSYNRTITINTHSPLSKGTGSRSITNRVMIHPDKGYMNSPAWSETNLQHRTDASCSTEEDSYIQSDKILEIDSGKNLNHQSFGREYEYEYEYEYEGEDEEEFAFRTAENSPYFYPASSRRQSPMAPTESDTSAASCPTGYSGCPRSYMAYTESSRAKARALSAPRQRPEQCNERADFKRRPSIQQRMVSSAALRAGLASNGYTGSGRLDGLGTPGRSTSKRFAIVDV